MPPAVPPTPEALHSLVTSVPAKTLHTYVLDNIPAAPPDTLAALASFFATLSPPPLLHCVRCHNDFIDVENGDYSCLVPHDEYSGEAEWIGWTRNSEEYETVYGCCGQTVEGDGDQGPPDGWCYEGMHTTDRKLARFREDSTESDDQLVSCLELNCHNIRARRSKTKRGARARASTSGRANRARPTANEGDSDDEDGGTEGKKDTGIAGIARGVSALGPKNKGKGKGSGNKRAPKPNAEMAAATAGTSTSTPARGQGRSRSRVGVQVPRSEQQENDGGGSNSKAKAPAVAATATQGTAEGEVVRKRRKVTHSTA